MAGRHTVLPLQRGDGGGKSGDRAGSHESYAPAPGYWRMVSRLLLLYKQSDASEGYGMQLIFIHKNFNFYFTLCDWNGNMVIKRGREASHTKSI